MVQAPLGDSTGPVCRPQALPLTRQPPEPLPLAHQKRLSPPVPATPKTLAPGWEPEVVTPVA